MTTEALAALKAYCHVDHDDDDALLTSLHGAAVSYLDNAGICAAEAPAELYTLAIHVLVLEWYNGEGINSGVSIGARQIINQLKLSAATACE